MLRIETAGHSHGPAISGILTGMPEGVAVNEDDIKQALMQRRTWYGRGPRQDMEPDEFRVIGGVRNGFTTSDPLTIVVENRDSRKSVEALTVPVPGHGDLGAAVRIGSSDFALVRERTSARETVVRVALGVIIRSFLREFGIEVAAHSVEVGKVVDPGPHVFSALAVRALRGRGLGMIRNDGQAMDVVNQARKDGISVGGRVRLVINGLAPGIGGYETWSQKLDARLAGALMEIPAIKAVEIGRIGGRTLWATETYGPLLPGGITTGMSGGIEAGMTTGGPIEAFVYIKPVSGVRRTIRSLDLGTFHEAAPPYIRSDTTAIGPAIDVIEAQAVTTIANALLMDLGTGTTGMLRKKWLAYCDRTRSVTGCPGPLVLCGMPASGKTTIGNALALALDRDFIDTDQVIARERDMNVSDLIRSRGMTTFRKIEADTVTRVMSKSRSVIALGGGALNNDVIAAIRSNDGVLIHLDANPDSLVDRIVALQTNLPLFDGLDRNGVIEKCKKILGEREGFYNNADIRIPTAGMNRDMVLDEVLARIGQWRSYRDE